MATLLSLLLRISLFFCLTAQAAGTAGLTYDFYRGTGPSPSLNPLTYPTIIKTGISPTINYSGSWGGTNSVLDTGYWDRFIVHWYGYINIPTAGTYTFGGNSDDGLIIKVNNTTVVDAWYDSGGAFKQGTPITLSAGVVPVEVWYYENGGGQAVNFQWYLNNSWQVVGSTYLATNATYWVPTYSSGITSAQSTRKASETTQRTSQSGNQVIVEQIGDNNNFTIRQGITITGKNRIELYSNGNYNTLNLNQGYSTNGTASIGDSNDHYLSLTLNGNTNTVVTQQTGISQWNEINLTGNNNNITNIQNGNGNKILFENVNGNNNTVNTNQKDSGNQYLDIKLTGNGHSVTAVQEGSGNHAATIDFTNAGGASSLNLNQLGSTAQTYSIQQSCVNAAGCSTTITQP